MKLMYCRCCRDIVLLKQDSRSCLCGKIWGKYTDGGVIAEISHDAVPIAINNLPFERALQKRDDDGNSAPFEACVIKKGPERIRFLKEPRP